MKKSNKGEKGKEIAIRLKKFARQQIWLLTWQLFTANIEVVIEDDWLRWAASFDVSFGATSIFHAR